jgi:hypothetical protein
MPIRRRYSLIACIKEMLASNDMANLDASDRSLLRLLADTPGADEVWTNILKVCGIGMHKNVRVFIREVLAARHNAANQVPDYISHAKMAGRLARFLRELNPPLPPLPVNDNSIAAVDMLNHVASMLHEAGSTTKLRRSRRNDNVSREHTQFMRLLSLTMHDWFSRWFDAEVAFITNVYFPETVATVDSVRATRRPTTHRHRLTRIAHAR